jgi:protocatechuate 3,4-dioxygenase beta subunit
VARWTKKHKIDHMNRRDFLKAVIALPTALLVPVVLRPTPALGDENEPTPSMGTGPFYKPSSPERTSLLESGITGTKIVLTGKVLSTNDRSIPNALVDFWQADASGNYDTSGFKLRGHQFTNDRGQYALETIIPGGYSGRTRHIHVRVQPPNGNVLTTQLFFPGEPLNQSDFLFRPDLLVKRQEHNASFDFVLAIKA